MANMCSNYLKVGATAVAARPFLEKLKKGGFGAFVPELTDADAEWRCRNWGDKWDIEQDESEFDIEHGKGLFVTAWEPPTEWFRAVATQYPGLTFELHYEESGNRLFGWMKSQDGVLTFATEKWIGGDDSGVEGECGGLESRAYDWYMGL